HCCVVDGDMTIVLLFLLLMPLQAALNGFEQRGGDGLLRALFRDQQQAGDVRRDAGQAEQREDGEGDADQRHVDGEVVRDAGADAGEHAPVVGAAKRWPPARPAGGCCRVVSPAWFWVVSPKVLMA